MTNIARKSLDFGLRLIFEQIGPGLIQSVLVTRKQSHSSALSH
jgi:hypothetical protein